MVGLLERVLPEALNHLESFVRNVVASYRTIPVRLFLFESIILNPIHVLRYLYASSAQPSNHYNRYRQQDLLSINVSRGSLVLTVIILGPRVSVPVLFRP